MDAHLDRRPAPRSPGCCTAPLLANSKNGSLAQCPPDPLVASNLPRPSTASRPQSGRTAAARPAPSQRPGFALIQGSLSGRRISRSGPLLGILHRATDGTLAGLTLCLLGLGALTLHWQNRWGESFHQLESAQVLEHRMQESAAQLEQHFLAAVRRPGWLVPTSSEKLIYLAAPATVSQSRAVSLPGGLRLAKVPGGY